MYKSDFKISWNTISHPGIIIPALPEKQTLGRFSPEFIEGRRRALEKFLARVAAHSSLVDSHHFITFLTADDVAFAIAKKTVKQEVQEKHAAKSGGMLSWFDSKVKAVIASDTASVEKSAADVKIEEIM